MARVWSRTAVSVALALVFGAAWFAPVLAQNSAFTEEYDRTGMTYMHMLYQYQKMAVAPQWETEDGSASTDMDGANMWGIGLGYFFTDKIGLHFETTMGSTNFYGTGAGYGIGRDVFLNNGYFNLSFYPLAKRFTPYLTGGIGWQYLEASLTNMPVTPGYCYWDPWWGYICTGASYPVYSTTQFVYNFGLGFRWDAPSNFFIKAGIGANWLKYPESTVWSRLGDFNIAFGVNY
jgi:opacity protein-like surface antigen